MSICVALADSDPLSKRKSLSIAELKGHDIIGINGEQMPGGNRWITSLCRAAGFKARFAASADGIANVLSLVASESAVTLMPDYFSPLF